MRILKLLPYVLFAGLIADAAYLSSKYYDFYYRGGFLNSLGCGSGCDTVMMSPYALIFKIPVPFYGLAFYLLTLSAYIYLDRGGTARIFELMLLLGCLAAAIFIYILYFQIQASCNFCLAAHGMFVTLTAIYFLWLRR